TVERAAGGWGLTLGFDGDAPSGLDWAVLTAGLPGLVALRIKDKSSSWTAWGPELLDAGSLDVPLLKTPGAFRQPNDAGARWLHSHIAELCAGLKPQMAWDLYGGGGLLGSAALAAGARLWLVEADPLAAADAEVNLSRLGGGYRVTAGTVERALADGPPESHDKPDLVILDPPRTGLPKGVIESLVTRRPPLVAYVSCNPATFWRDAALLTKGGYEVERLAAFDMLPQTPGVELVGLFHRAGGTPG
ncbi:MAG TPA: hypothetical protein ENN88_01170, partial [Candidatus Coatesbacteria bacterium]|nr:hypothetical protein [Candidatus Coatesbacteria bacterium]